MSNKEKSIIIEDVSPVFYVKPQITKLPNKCVPILSCLINFLALWMSSSVIRRPFNVPYLYLLILDSGPQRLLVTSQIHDAFLKSLSAMSDHCSLGYWPAHCAHVIFHQYRSNVLTRCSLLFSTFIDSWSSLMIDRYFRVYWIFILKCLFLVFFNLIFS